MRTIEYIIVFLFVSFISKAQLPFPTKNTTWKYITYCPEDSIYRYNSTGYTGAFMIHKSDTCFELDNGYFLKVKGKRVFALSILSATDTTEQLIYDFNLEIGDTMFYNWSGSEYNFLVTNIDSILIGNKYRKRWHVGSRYWTEGIGSDYQLVDFHLIHSNKCYSGLWCFNQNDTIFLSSCDSLPIYIYPKNSDTLKSNVENILHFNSSPIFPNPASSKIAFDTKNQRIADVSVYNALGNLMKRDALLTKEMDVSDLEDGLYTLVVTCKDGSRQTSRLVILK